MKFVKQIDQYGKAYTRLDLEGLVIPYDGGEFPSELLDFHYDTYQITGANANEDEWEKVFGPTHKFFKTRCTESDLIEIACTLALMQTTINTAMLGDGVSAPVIDGTSMGKLESTLSQMLCKMEQKLNLYNRLVDFITEGEVPIRPTKDAGEKPQHTNEMTWYMPGFIRLTAVALLCKLLAPVFGVFMSYFKSKLGVLDGTFKEMHCVTILRDTLANCCPETMDKLEVYLRNSVTRMLGKEEDLTHVINGYTDIAIHQLIYAQLLVRRFILVDLYRDDGNLATYITSCARSAASTQFSNNNFKTAACTFTYPNEASSSDEGNLSNLEVESRSSSKTADYPLLIEAATRETVRSFIHNYSLDKKVLNSITSEYKNFNHVDMQVFNSYLLGVVFGSDLCGARSVEMLSPSNLADLVGLLQYYVAMQGYRELAIALTARRTDNRKGRLSGSEAILRSTWNTNYEFQNCNNKFPIELGGFAWFTSLRESVTEFTDYEYVVNVAPAVWDILREPSTNGNVLVLSETFAKDVCGFILQHYPD